jgi:hypothetical protein
VYSKLRQRWYLIAGAVAVLLGACVVYHETHTELAPITGRKRFIAVTHEQFKDIVEAQAKEVRPDKKICVIRVT